MARVSGWDGSCQLLVEYDYNSWNVLSMVMAICMNFFHDRTHILACFSLCVSEDRGVYHIWVPKGIEG